MRKRAAVLAGVLTLGLCAGCGQADAVQEQESAGVQADAETDREVAESESVLSDDADAAQESGSPSEAPSPSLDEGQADADAEGVPKNGRRLTSEELAEYTAWVQDVSNYGFLLSDWENPTQINLYQVFYCGAGISREGTEEEKQAHMARWNQPEIYTDFWAMDKADVDALLTEKVGFTYDQLVAEGNQGMEENYYAETDSFCVEAGDTNYCQFLCTDGVMDEDGETVTLYCDGDDWVRTCEVRVNVEGERKTFLDNHIAEGAVRNTEEFVEVHEEE